MICIIEKYSACRRLFFPICHFQYFLEMTILGARNAPVLSDPFWSRLSSTFRADIQIRNLVNLSRGTNSFAITTANDHGRSLTKGVSRLVGILGSDLAGKQGCAFGLTLRRRYVLLMAASISLLTQPYGDDIVIIA